MSWKWVENYEKLPSPFSEKKKNSQNRISMKKKKVKLKLTNFTLKNTQKTKQNQTK